MICIVGKSVSRNVVFYEHVFPFFKTKETQSHSHEHTENTIDELSFLFDVSPNATSTSAATTHTPNFLINSDHIVPKNTNPLDLDSGPVTPETVPTRRSSRTQKAPDYLKDFHCHLSQSQGNCESFHQGNVLYPLSSILSYNSLSPFHLAYTLAISTHVEPNTYNQAIKCKEWIQAMNNELAALEQNNTWSLTQLP